MTGGRKICLIDDNAMVRDALALGLRDAGLDVATADDGEAGLALIAGGRPDLVVTDLHLPGMSGAALIEAIRARFPGLKVIAISGSGPQAADGAEAADRYLAKPFRVKALIGAIEETLG